MKRTHYLGIRAVLLVCLVSPFALFAQTSDNHPPLVKPIHAVLTPPTTTFTIEASDPDGDSLTYHWDRDIGCGMFMGSQGPSATWSHPEGMPPLGCPHEDGTSHDGTIAVHISDGKASVLCSYEGSESGEGPECLADAPEYYPGIFEDWADYVDELCYWLWLPLLALLIGLPWWLSENGLFIGREEDTDPCAKERAAEAAARARYEAAKAAFDAIDATKRAAESAERAAFDAAKAAEAAARAAGGRWSAHGSTDWEGEHIEVHKEGWQNKELGQKADEAGSVANDAKAQAKKAKDEFAAHGGDAAWSKAKSEMEAAKSAWEAAASALKVCVGGIGVPAPTPAPKGESTGANTGGGSSGGSTTGTSDGGGKTEPTTTDGGTHTGTTPPPEEKKKPEQHFVCNDGDERKSTSESVTVQILDLQSVRLMQDKIYSDAGNEAMKFVDYLQTSKDLFMLGKSMKGGAEAYLEGSLEGASDAVGLPDFLTWYDKGIDELTKGMYQLYEIMQDKQRLGDYWLEYNTKRLTLTCTRREVCEGNRWVKHCSLTVEDHGMETHRTNPESVLDVRELQRAISKLFTQLRNRYKGDQTRAKQFSESCQRCL